MPAAKIFALCVHLPSVGTVMLYPRASAHLAHCGRSVSRSVDFPPAVSVWVVARSAHRFKKIRSRATLTRPARPIFSDAAALVAEGHRAGDLICENADRLRDTMRSPDFAAIFDFALQPIQIAAVGLVPSPGGPHRARTCGRWPRQRTRGEHANGPTPAGTSSTLGKEC
jgi:hypothetical protein